MDRSMSLYDDSQLFDALVAVIRRRIPGFKIIYKDESLFHKFLSVILFFCPTYMTGMTTTIGKTVAFPSKEFVLKNRMKAFKILAHEYVHMLDWETRPVVFPVIYLLPQAQAFLALAGFAAVVYSNWWLFALVALGFLAPLPAFGRAQLELRGYAMSMAINIWRHGSIRDDTRDWIVGHFTHWSYYKMWPFEQTVRGWIANAEELVFGIDRIGIDPDVTSLFDQSEAFGDVYTLLTGIEFDEPMEE